MSVNYTIKPDGKDAGYFTPSAMYKSKCPRCFWLKYWHKFSLPANLSLQIKLAKIQENFLDGIDSSVIDEKLPAGKIKLYKGKKYSRKILVDGVPSRFHFQGELDLLIEYTDGKLGIIDAKASLKADEESLVDDYLNQLHSYLFMLECPRDDQPLQISTLGVIQWQVSGSIETSSQPFGFTVNQRYIPFPINRQGFEKYCSSIIKIIEGDFPDQMPGCYDCDWLRKIGFDYGA